MSVPPVDPGSRTSGSSAPEGYTVKSGDTLTDIAKAHGVSLAALETANPQILHPDLIYPGQHVTIPEGGSGGGKAAPTTDYTVKSGDTLSAIGDRFGVDWRVLAQTNHLSNPDLIRPGQHITISGGGSGGGGGGGSPAPTGPAGGTPGAANAPGGSEAQRAQQAVTYFESQGWTHAQASGIVANLEHESGLRTGAVGDGGSAYGLAQWHPDRQAAFQQMTGHSIRNSTYAEQLQFVQYELTHGERGAAAQLRSTTTAYDAGAAVSRYYERPLNTDSEAASRGASARQVEASTR